MTKEEKELWKRYKDCCRAFGIKSFTVSETDKDIPNLIRQHINQSREFADLMGNELNNFSERNYKSKS